MIPSPFLPSPDRQELMLRGVDQLEIWLYDLIRVGLLQYDFGPESMFEISSRMVDAKMGGVAKRLRRLSSMNRSDPSWFQQILGVLSELFLIVSALRNKDELPEDLLISVYQLAGYSIQKNQLLSLPGISDRWLICGIEFEEEDNLRSRHTWVMGAESKRIALLLDFAFGRSDFEIKYQFKNTYQGKVIYYPGTFPLRAYLDHPISSPKINYFPAAFETVEKFLDIYALAISKNPWISDFPACLKQLKLLKSKESFFLQDTAGNQLPLSNEPEEIWPVFASLAMQPCSCFGIWNTQKLRLLSVIDGKEFYQINK